MRHFVLISVLLCVLLSTAIGLALLSGKRAPLPTSITTYHLNDCALPCWAGILPGETSLSEVGNRLRAAFGNAYTFNAEPVSNGRTAVLNIDGSLSSVVTTYIQAIEIKKGSAIFTTTATYALAKNVSIPDSKLMQLGMFGTLNGRLPTPAEVIGTFGLPQCVVIDQAIIELIYTDQSGHLLFGLIDALQDFKMTHPFRAINQRQVDSPKTDCLHWRGLVRLWQ